MQREAQQKKVDEEAAVKKLQDSTLQARRSTALPLVGRHREGEDNNPGAGCHSLSRCHEYVEEEYTEQPAD
eukprot:3257417-Pyramimonas_sp.AAC.2